MAASQSSAPRRKPFGRSRREAYATRMMLALVASLGVILVGVHLLPATAVHRVGWRLSADERLSLLDLDLDRATETAASSMPVTSHGVPEPAGPEPEQAPIADKPEPLPEPSTETAPSQRVEVLEFAEIQPQIQGGLSAYYLMIEYPAAARDAGIQGRLTLDFIVETDGRPTRIQVLKSLHPLCDSAAVRALRRTRFLPGRQDGELVPVRMRLPVRFKLIGLEEPVRPVETSE